MKQFNFASCAVGACAIFVVLLGGCMSVPNSPTPRFYSLEPISQDKAAKKFNISPDIIIRIGPVRIPEYLKRPQIVTKDKDGRLIFAEFDRWGDSLDLALGRLISEDLTAMLPQANIDSYHWNIVIPVDYQVLVDVLQLESELDKDLFLVVQWSIINAQNNKLVMTKRSEFRNRINPHNYLGLVRTLSAACASLSEEIAEKVASLPEKSPKKLPEQ